MMLRCGSMRELARSRLGTLLDGKWLLESLLGVGGSAAVYGATHRNGTHAAIKVLHPTYSAVPEFVRRFMREAHVSNLLAHPGAVAVIDDDRSPEGHVYMVM